MEELQGEGEENERVAAFHARAAAERDRMARETGKHAQKHQNLRDQFGTGRVDAWYAENQQYVTASATPQLSPPCTATSDADCRKSSTCSPPLSDGRVPGT